MLTKAFRDGVALAACACMPALAAEEPSTTPPPQDVDQVLESARQSVRSTSEWLVAAG